MATTVIVKSKKDDRRFVWIERVFSDEAEAKRFAAASRKKGLRVQVKKGTK